MIVTVLHPGEMGISVAAAAVQSGHKVLWVSEGRSKETKQRAESQKLEDISSLSRIVDSEIVISVCPPQSAFQIAEAVAETGFTGLYLDANAASPESKISIAQMLKSKNIDLVDGGIIGLPAHSPNSTRLYVSGPRCGEIKKLFLEGLLGFCELGDEVGQAAALKMAYGAWTKGSSALILAVRAMARSSGVESALIDEWKLSQPNAEEKTLLSASLNSPKAWRFVYEMQEISKTFKSENIPNTFWDAAGEVYERLESFKNLSPDEANIDLVIQKLIESGDNI